jgi:hypothetical protein
VRDVLWRDPAAVHHELMDDDRTLQDMDTPEAYAKCLARYGREALAGGEGA